MMDSKKRLRTRVLLLAALGCLLLFGTAAVAEDSSEETKKDSSETSSEDGGGSEYREEIEVLAREPDLEIEKIDLEVLDTGRAPNLALALESVPGVSGIRRSQNSFEPVVHGLGWERVQTQVNGMPLYGACPARMDPPAFIVTASSAESVTVVKGLASVSLGPAGTGGRIDVSTDYDRGTEPGKTTDPWVRLSYNSANDGLKGGAGVKGGTDKIDYSAGVEILDQSDYESADGQTIPAGQKETGAFFSFGHRPAEGQRWSIGAIRQEGEDIAYPSLPMDTESSDTTILSADYNYQRKKNGGGLSSLELSLGASEANHIMNNRYRTNRPMMEAETDSDAKTYSVGFVTRWLIGSQSVVKGGLDVNSMERDAIRTRFVTGPGLTFHDHLWPDVSQDDIGLYGEYSQVLSSDWKMRFGLRYDDVSSKAAAADDPALGGGTVREAYVEWYGPEAAKTDRDESLFTGNAVFSKNLGGDVVLQFGLGYVTRAAGVTERYFAYALSPAGLLVGNPTLDAEAKRELSIGVTFGGAMWDGSVTGYYYSINDYILPVVLGSRDIGGTVTPVRGFENTDATLTGIDFSFRIRPSQRWSIPGSIFYVRGEDDTRGVPLPEIPPLELALAGRWSFPGRVSGWLELGGRYVAEADRIDPDWVEDETPSFTVWHLRGRFDVARYMGIEAGVENLFNEEYWEHLTREAAGNVPGLVPGQNIPQPGRFLTLALVFNF